jgi:S-formylglutathione hydrolase
MNKAMLITLFALLSVNVSIGQTVAGQLNLININSPSLSNNIIGDPSTEKIAVYLPPSYAASEKHYPVVYFLVGHDDDINVFLNGAIQGFNVKTSMDNLISAGTIKEMIFVLLDGMNLLDGSFYENSPVTGNWRDWVSGDVVSYIDKNYRTIPKRESRAITGHSMGGFGAVNIGMKNSETFGIVYALSAGLFDLTGVKDQGMFSSAIDIKSFLTRMNDWKQMEKPKAIEAYKAYVTSARTSGNWFTCFMYGYGAAFSPDPDAYPPFLKYPYYLENNQLKCDSTYLKNYESGFGGLAEEVVKYKSNILSLIDFTLDYGTNDYYQWICRGNRYLSQLMTSQNIPHQILSYSGDHSNKIRSRIEQFMLPRLSEKLEFEKVSTDVKEGKSMLHNFELFQNYPNPFNPDTKIRFGLPGTGFTKLTIYDSLGREVKSLINRELNAGFHEVNFNAGNLASGMYTYRIETNGYAEMKKMLFIK